MTVNIRNLCFAATILIATSSLAYGQIRGKPTPPPPPSTNNNNVFGDELRYAPIGGTKSQQQVKVLGKCRIKYSKALSINAEWNKRFGRTGWWCVYKPKNT